MAIEFTALSKVAAAKGMNAAFDAIWDMEATHDLDRTMEAEARAYTSRESKQSEKAEKFAELDKGKIAQGMDVACGVIELKCALDEPQAEKQSQKPQKPTHNKGHSR